MVIRNATQNDLTCWSKMRTELWPNSNDNHVSELKAFFAGNSIDIVETYLLEIDAGIIGFMELNIRNFAEGSRSPKLPYIEAWYIKPEFRGQGYGKQLILKAEQWALEHGYKELASDTEIDNRNSIAIHHHLGFKETERIVCFLKNLD